MKRRLSKLACLALAAGLIGYFVVPAFFPIPNSLGSPGAFAPGVT
jgi:hypothetical protein